MTCDKCGRQTPYIGAVCSTCGATTREPAAPWDWPAMIARSNAVLAEFAKMWRRDES